MMCDKEKQIEEMAKDVTGSIVWRSLEDDFLTVDGFRTAEALYEIGYRKQVEGEWLECVKYNGIEDCEDVFYQCSVCGLCSPWALNFCMDCGAKMKGGESDA
jgi:hypothetical protein